MKQYAQQFAIYWAPLLIWMGVIFAWSSLSSDSVEELAPELAFIVELAHVGEFAILSALAYWAFRTVKKLPLRLLWIVTLAFTVLYGISDEAHQMFTPGRSASLADVALDAVGGAAGLIFADVLLRVALRRRIVCDGAGFSALSAIEEGKETTI